MEHSWSALLDQAESDQRILWLQLEDLKSEPVPGKGVNIDIYLARDIGLSRVQTGFENKVVCTKRELLKILPLFLYSNLRWFGKEQNNTRID